MLFTAENAENADSPGRDSIRGVVNNVEIILNNLSATESPDDFRVFRDFRGK